LSCGAIRFLRLLGVELVLPLRRSKLPQRVEILIAHRALPRRVEGLLIISRADSDEAGLTAGLQVHRAAAGHHLRLHAHLRLTAGAAAALLRVAAHSLRHTRPEALRAGAARTAKRRIAKHPARRAAAIGLRVAARMQQTQRGDRRGGDRGAFEDAVHRAAPILTTILVLAARQVNDRPFYFENSKCSRYTKWSTYCAWAICLLPRRKLLNPPHLRELRSAKTCRETVCCRLGVLLAAAGPPRTSQHPAAQGLALVSLLEGQLLVNRTLRSYFLALGWLAVILAADFAFAQRPTGPQILPHYTLAAVRITDVPQLAERFQQTALGRVGQDPQMKPLVGQVFKAAQDAFKQVEGIVGLPLDQLLKIPQGEVCVGFVAPPDSEQDPGLVIVIDTKDQADQARKLLAAAETIAQRRGGSRSIDRVAGEEVIVFSGLPPGRIFCIERDGTFVIATTKPVMEAAIANLTGAGAEKSLAENDNYNLVLSRCIGQGDEQPQITWFADPIAFIRRMAKGPQASIGIALFPVLGLDGVQAAGGTMTFAAGDFDEVRHYHLLLSDPRTGVVDAIGLSSGDMTPESWVPAECVSYSTIHWDLRHTLNASSRLYDAIMGEGELQQLLRRRISDPLGADFEKEIIPQLTGRATHAQWVEKPVRLDGVATMIGVQLKGPKAAAPVFEKIMQKHSGFLERQRYGTVDYWSAKNALQPRRQREGGPQRRQPLPCFGIINDYLVFTDSLQAFQEAVTSKTNPEQSLNASLDFKLIASKIRRQPGGDAPGAMQFTRPEEGLRYWYDLVNAEDTRRRLGQGAENNAFLGSLQQALKNHPLPPFEVISEYMAPGGGVITNDDTGIHYTTFTLKRK
jgi:hypothetical protein